MPQSVAWQAHDAIMTISLFFGAEDQPTTKTLLSVSSSLDGVGKLYGTGVCPA
jgi:hypothetical protein